MTERLRGAAIDADLPPPSEAWQRDHPGWDRTGEASDHRGDAFYSKAIEATAFTWKLPSRLPTRSWIYDRHYIRKYAGLTIAASGIGKSTLVIVEALAMATGRPLLGVVPTGRTKVWLWNGEDPMDELERRVAAAASHYALDRDEIEGWLYLDSGRDQEIVIAHQQGGHIIPNWVAVEQICATIRSRHIGVMIVDPYVSAHRIVENDNTAMDLVAKLWCRIADETNCAIELVHHARKIGGNEVTVDDGRGGNALIAAARSVRLLQPMSEAEAVTARVEQRRQYFRVVHGKSNLAPPSEVSTWFELKSVALGNGPFEGEGDFVGVVSRWQWPDPFANVTLRDLQAVQLEVSRGGPWREHHSADDWVGIVVGRLLELDPEDKSDRAQIRALIKTWVKTGMLKVVERPDMRRIQRKYVEVGTWATE